MKQQTGLGKPKLPAYFYEKSGWDCARFVAYALSVWLLPLGLAGAILSAAWTPGAKWITLPPLLALSGQGLHLLGWVGHEGFHGNLAGNRHLSALLAILFTGPVAFFSTVGENSIHWRHHQFTNRRGDPQIEIFPPFRSLPSRLLLARSTLEIHYLRHLLLLALDRLEVAMAFERKTSVFFARLDLASSSLWLALYIGIGWRFPLYGLVLIVLPHMFAFALSSLRPYAEHAGTGTADFQTARSLTSPWMSVLYYGNNYHLEHHLYPSVPCARLPQVHRYLSDSGVYAHAHISHRLLDAVRCATSAFPYPSAAATQDAPGKDTVTVARP